MNKVILINVILASILVIVVSFSLNTFVRLSDASKKYKQGDFENACHVSKSYVKIGRIFLVILLIIGFILLGLSLYTINKDD